MGVFAIQRFAAISVWPRKKFNLVDRLFMMLFHVGAVAALFFFTWNAFFVAIFFILGGGESGNRDGFITDCSPIAAIRPPNGWSTFLRFAL